MLMVNCEPRYRPSCGYMSGDSLFLFRQKQQAEMRYVSNGVRSSR